MTPEEKIQELLAQRRNAPQQKQDDYDRDINRALIRAGATILAGYTIGTLIGMLITR